MKKLVITALGLATLLVACPDPIKPPVPSDTVAETPAKPTNGTLGSLTDLINGVKALQDLPNSTGSSLQNSFQQISDAMVPNFYYTLPANANLNPTVLLNAIRTQSLQPLAVTNVALPTGDYNCLNITAVNLNCVKTASSDYKIAFKNKKTGATVTLFMDWDGSTAGSSSAPQAIALSDSGAANTVNLSLPTKAVFYLQVGNTKIVEGNLEASYGKSSPQGEAEYLRVNSSKLQGLVRNLNGDKMIVLRGLTASFDAASNKIKTTGDFSVFDSKTFRARWSVELGMIPNGNTTMPLAINRFKPNGDSDVAASLEIDTDMYAFAFKTSNLVESPFALSIADGLLFQKGKTATFSGVISNNDGDCVPGEQLNVTTASGTSTLESIIFNNFSIGCANK